MKWKTLATKISNRIRSGSVSSAPDPAPISAEPSPSSATAMDEQQQKYSSRRKSEPSTASLEDMAMDNVQVSVRIRPLIREERDVEVLAWLWEDKMISADISKMPQRQTTLSRSAVDQIQSHTPTASYAFDNLFLPEHSNEHIFNKIVKPITAKAMQGYHGSIFSYGQTSSGKTFTMNGTSKHPGVIPLSIFECFESIGNYRDREFLFRVSYLEIYNETVHDLLNPEVAQIKIQHDPRVGTVLVGAKEQVVMNPAQVIALLQGGEAHRHVGSTDMNEKSSRSHTLFRLIIESKARSDSSDVPIRVSTLNLVDLAGSECAKMTNSKGMRAREAKYINQSLLTLSTIIHRLSEEDDTSTKATQHLPYRDSKLTRILQTALSGNALISIICTIAPTIKCFEESNNTLKFATRAKKIKMDARVNESMDDKTLLRAYRLEIEQLKAKLAEVESVMQLKVTEQQPDVVETEESQLFMLQMIDHMERLILKGEEKAKEEETANRKSIEPKREMKSRKSEGVSKGTQLSKKVTSESNNSPSTIRNEVGSNGNMDRDPADGKQSNQRQKKESKIAQLKGKKPGQLKKASTLPNPPLPIVETVLPAPEVDDSMESTVNPRETAFEAEDEENEDFFAGINRNRENILRASHDTNDHPVVRHTSSKDSEMLLPSVIETILSGSRESLLPSVGSVPDRDKVKDPVLQGVSQMLSLLKQHVQKPKQSIIVGSIDGNEATPLSKFRGPRRSSTNLPQLEESEHAKAELVHQLRMELHLKEADNKFLQGELDKANDQITAKDNMLNMLTEGLKEVEVNQANLLAANDSMSRELDIVHRAYEDVVAENEILKNEVRRLMKCLEAREKQFFEVTGRSIEAEEF